MEKAKVVWPMGHVTRISDLSKTRETANGLENNIENWTKFKLTESQTAAQNRDQWREISMRSAKDASTT